MATKAMEDDDPVIQVAINESVQPADPSTDASTEPEPAPRVTIDDMIGKLQGRNVIKMPNFDDPEGDTLIYIDAAQQQPEQNPLDYEAYVERCRAPCRMQKETVMKLNSPVINSAFEPGAQYRVLRRRRLVNKLPLGIKYVLDLTAPGEGDDAAFLLSALSCSKRLRLWHRSKKIWSTSAQLVGGEEEYISVAPNFPTTTDASKLSLAPEYTPVRHRAAIERLLAMAVGVNPQLDSAVKIWTTFAVAQYLGIVHSPLTDYIVVWLRAYPNSIFLEVLTETSHIMADHLQVAPLARDTFAMLVGEEALDSMFRSRAPHSSRSRSTFGRRKDDLPEKLKTRVEYGSKKFADRVIADFENLKEAKWIQSLPEFQKLSSFTQPELQSTVSRLKTSLEEWVRGYIMHIQRSQYLAVPETYHPFVGDEDLVPLPSRLEILNSLTPEERLLTRSFWHALTCFYPGTSNLDIVPEWTESPTLAIKTKEPDLKKDGYHRVRRSGVTNLIDHGEDILVKLNRPNVNLDSRIPAHDLSKPISTESAVKTKQEEDNQSLRMIDLALRPKFEENLLQENNANYPELSSHGHRSNIYTNQTFQLSTLSHRPFESLAASPEKEKTSKVSDIHTLLNSLDDQMREPPTASASASNDTPPEQVSAPYSDSLATKTSPGDNVLDTLNSASFSKWMDDQWSDDESKIKDENKPTKDNNHTLSKPAGYPSRTPASALSTFSPLLPQPPRFFSLPSFLAEVTAHISHFASLKLAHTDATTRTEPHELKLLNTLVSLDEPEFQYLPLWADGCDDDSGGVFSDEAPIPDVSFATAGPGVVHGAGGHTVSECDTISLDGVPRGGLRTPGSSVASSEYDMLPHLREGTSEVASTVLPSSNHTTAGFSSESGGHGLFPGRVYAADSIDDDDASMDGFSVVGREEGVERDLEEENARRVVEAMERAEAEREMGVGVGGGVGEDENYADLWGGEGDEEGEDDEMGGFESEGSGDTVMVDGEEEE